ncbi:MAG: PQQ-binding-like beta-propeller repeat protein [Bacteroidales bacterium]|nr:PQQ-binding-like beta-propeller repeat protein [Bacteroidales bacterium]
MKKTNLLLNTLIIILLNSTTLFSQDWPQFRGPGRDSKVTGFKNPASWPAELTQLWKINVGTGDATPVLAGKNIYLHTRQGAEEIVLCLNALSGKELWRYSYAAPAVTGPSSSHSGPRSTPVVAGGKVFTVGVAGTLSCLDATTGKLLWHKEDLLFPATQFFGGISPIITDGKVIVQLGGKDNGYVCAYDINTGNERWKYTGEGPAYGSPSILTIDKTKLLVFATEKSFLALNCTDGKLAWKTDAITQQRFFNAVSPVINGQTIFFTGSGSGTKTLQISKDGAQYKINELWNNPAAGAKFCTPILKDGFLFGFSDQRRIYCINASTGQTAWIDNAVNSDFGTIVDCGYVIIGLASTGNLIVFKADPAAYTEIAKYKVSETPVYAFPVIAGNIIYVKDAENLIMYKIN